MQRFIPPAFGWLADLPDFRDFSPQSPGIVRLLGILKARRSRKRPDRVDLRKFFPEPFDQGPLHASSAHACVALLEYFEQRAHGHELRTSRLFLYKSARRMAMVTGNAGVNLRASLKAITCCGVPPERFWPYDVERFDVEPDAFLYSFATPYQDLRYLRLDARNGRGDTTLDTVRAFLAAGFPAVFGFAVPTSISHSAEIPYRPTFDSICGGQTLVAVGYDDAWLSGSRGALLVRNSWSDQWGDNGYGWLPYAYVEERLAYDFWTVLRRDWLESGDFQRPLIGM